MSRNNHFLQRKSDNNNNNHRNMFSNKKMVPKFNYHENEFPDLGVVDNEKKEIEEENKEKEALNFKDAALKESPEQTINRYILPDGWISYHYDSNRQVVKIDNSIGKTEEEEFEEEQIICNNHLLQNLRQYQIAYDELHGEGEYERVYSMKQDFYMEED